MKILVIDDSTKITAMLSRFFDSKGFEITISNDLMEGLNYIRNNKFDTILLDISMRVITGIGIIELLAGEDILKDQNVFILSEATVPEIQLKNLLRKDGIKGFLKKLIDLDELLVTITS